MSNDTIVFPNPQATQQLIRVRLDGTEAAVTKLAASW